MGLELWSYSNDSPRKTCVTKSDASAVARSPIRRRNAPPVIRRTIDLRRVPSTSSISPSVRDALGTADVSRRPRTFDFGALVGIPGELVHEPEPPSQSEEARRREADSTYSHFLGMELSSRPPRGPYTRSMDQHYRSSSDRDSATRATVTGGTLRRARPLRESDDFDRVDAAIAAARRSRVHAEDTDAYARFTERAGRRRQNWARSANPRFLRSMNRNNPSWTPTDTANLPPLRRMGRRQVTDGHMPPSGLRQSTLRESWSPTNVDGLGDRERSVSSPPSDHWETMLTTITPDAQLPSADSSFTSAAASASFSTSNTTSQIRTQSSRSASHGSTPTELTEPSIGWMYEDQQFCDTDDDVDSDEMLPRFRNPGHARHLTRLSSEEPSTRHWTTAPSPPAPNPSHYPDANSRLRGITSMIRNYNSGNSGPSGSRSQSPRSRNNAGTGRLTGPPANDGRRDSAAIVPNVSRPGSARNEQSWEAQEVPEIAGAEERFAMYIVDPDDPEQTQHRVPVYRMPRADDAPSRRDRGLSPRRQADRDLRAMVYSPSSELWLEQPGRDRDDVYDLYPIGGESDVETASTETARSRRARAYFQMIGERNRRADEI